MYYVLNRFFRISSTGTPKICNIILLLNIGRSVFSSRKPKTISSIVVKTRPVPDYWYLPPPRSQKCMHFIYGVPVTHITSS